VCEHLCCHGGAKPETGAVVTRTHNYPQRTMVFAAPIFLVTQTKALSAFYAANREPLLRLSLGATIAWLSLRLLSKAQENSQLAADAALSSRAHAQLLSRFESESWLAATGGAVAAAAPGARAAALSGALAAAVRDAAAAAAEAGAPGGKAREASWLPAGGALERAQAARATAAAGGGGSGGSVGGGGGGGGDAGAAGGGVAGAPSASVAAPQPAPPAAASQRRLI
jgi:hypothetical protein